MILTNARANGRHICAVSCVLVPELVVRLRLILMFVVEPFLSEQWWLCFSRVGSFCCVPV